MRTTSKLVAGAVASATLVALVTGPALADPTGTPTDTSIVGVGAGTTQYLLDQLSVLYDAKSPPNKLYSWDATNPDTLALGDEITTKANCAQLARPNGSSAGISTLAANAQPTGDKTNYCVDYARSSRARASTDPPYATGGVAFVAFAHDATTYATRSLADGGTNAPENLTLAQLTAIYTCTDTNWDQVGGPNAPIDAYIPQSGSGIRTAWLTALGLTSPGTCVSDLPTGTDPSGTLEQNEGINPVFNDINAIFPFSIGSYQSQLFRSPKCINSDCSPLSPPTSPPCKPSSGQNKFGCDETGFLALDEIGTGGTAVALKATGSSTITSGTASTTFTLPTNGISSITWKTSGKCKPSGVTCAVSGTQGTTLTVSGLGSLAVGSHSITGTLTDSLGDTYALLLTIKVTAGVGPAAASSVTIQEDPNFDPTFGLTLYNVVRYDPSTSDHIPGSEAGAPGGINLEPVFGSSGYLCSKANRTVIVNYGFLTIGSACRSTS